jgi:hypothetical protein
MEVRHSLNEKGKHLVVNNAKFCQVRMLSESSIRFNPHMWGTSTTETTSVCERFHSHFKSNVYGIHPTIYIFVNKIVFSLLVSEGVIIDSRADPRSRISLPRLIIIFIINQGQ